MITLQKAIEISLAEIKDDIGEIVETKNEFIVIFENYETAIAINKDDGSYKFEHRLQRIFDDDFNNGIEHKF